jgi:hypothetical protein
LSLPGFNENGVLPAGDYELSLAELRESLFVRGPQDDPNHKNWDMPWRMTLVNNLEFLVRQLWQVGISGVFIDGSFVEDKDHPNDIDGYFECDRQYFVSGDLERELNLIDPHKIWTWDPRSRRPYLGYPKRQLPMWHVYRVELYPHYGQGAGIVDQFGNE